MKKTVLFLNMALTTIIISCTTPNIIVSNNLKQDVSVYEVKGRQGWQFNQIISYGDYSCSKVKRSWTTGSGYDFPFGVSFREADEKLSYTQYTPGLKTAQVFCIGQFKHKEISLISDFFGVSLEHEDFFAGSIINRDLNWDFIIYEPDASSLQDITTGTIRNQKKKEEEIIIKAVKEIEGQANWVKIDVHGFEFIKNGKAIGAISLLNNGRVWMSNNISDEEKLILSSVMTGLTVRHSMSEAANQEF